MLTVDEAFLKTLKAPPAQGELLDGAVPKHPMTDALVSALKGPQRDWHSAKMQRFLEKLQRQLPA